MQIMARVLITGMPGTGKSTAVAGLRTRGFAAIDSDDPGWSSYATIAGAQEWVWNEDRVRTWLSTAADEHHFIAGCCCIQRRLYPFFDIKVLLTAPLATILHRVEQRSANPYGRTASDRAAIARDVADIEPLLYQQVDATLDSTQLDAKQIVTALIAFADRVIPQPAA